MAFQVNAFQDAFQQEAAAVTGIVDAAVGDVEVLFGTPTVTANDGVANVTVEGIPDSNAFGTPVVAGDVPEEQTPAGSKKRRWIVEIDGRDYLVDSADEARALLEANRKVTVLPTKKKRTTRVVTVPEVRLEGLPAFRIEGVSVATKIQQGVPDEVLRAALEALDEDDLEVILLAA